MRKSGSVAYQIMLLFSFLGVLLIPFSFNTIPFHSKITRFFFEDIILFIASHIEGIHLGNPQISSDSTTLYLLLLVLFIFSILLVTFFSRFNFWKNNSERIEQAIQLVLVYYLSVIMLKYGFDKIFKAQFYLPEPNTLYTPLGMLDKDILYWSTMGTSHLYNLFMGFTEVIPAILILFSRTRYLGLLILLGVLMNVVFVNLGFDISVKLFSSFLLLLCLVLLVPSVNALGHFFVTNQPATLPSITGKNLILSNTKRGTFKSAMLILFFAEVLLPYIRKGHYNDDMVPRNYLHGAYEVFEIEKVKTSGLKVKRLFIHRKNYFIFQYEDDTMEDFYLEIKPKQNQFILTNNEGEKIPVQYTWSETSKTLDLKFVDMDMTLYTQSLPWRELPLLHPLFHWSVDEIGR